MSNQKIDLIDERSRRNINSMDVNEGLYFGNFQGSGYFIKVRLGNFIESNILIKGIWEPALAEIISSFLNDGEAVIDIGANIGASSIPLAKKYKNSYFYLFEPHPSIFEDLIENIKNNSLSNCTATCAAVSNSNSEITFYAQKDSNKNMGLSSTRLNEDIGDYEKVKTKSIRIDEHFLNSKIRIGIIKIDTQGSEFEVLSSATLTIEKWRPLVVFEFESEYFENETERQDGANKLLTFFRKLNYKLYAIQNNSKYYPVLNLTGYFNGDIVAVPC